MLPPCLTTSKYPSPLNLYFVTFNGILITTRQGRGNCDCTTCCWTSFGRYDMENYKRW
jgi:hypothetical protein